MKFIVLKPNFETGFHQKSTLFKQMILKNKYIN